MKEGWLDSKYLQKARTFRMVTGSNPRSGIMVYPSVKSVIFFKWANPGLFFVYFHLFVQIFSRQRDSNSDLWSSRRER